MAVARRPQPPARWGSPMDAAISRYGATGATAALLTVLASAYYSIGGHALSMPLFVLFYVAGAAEIVLVCRVSLPGWVQGGLILAIIASLTTLTARTDLFGVQRSAAAISAVPDTNDEPRARRVRP